jgi:anthranilate synthase component 2
MFLLIDNFDSFTFNLVQAFQQLGTAPEVVRNDRPELLGLAQSGKLTMVCISPGPSRPENAGLCLEFLKRLPKTVPVLGVCLGHQILGHFAGAPVNVAERIMHGKTSQVRHTGAGLFKGVESPMEVCRYHSLLVDAAKVPDKLDVTAWTEDEFEVMGLSLKDRPWVGVQFHPESILTPSGPKLLANFLNIIAGGGEDHEGNS